MSSLSAPVDSKTDHKTTPKIDSKIISASVNSKSAYVPGVCNINSAEVAYRRKAAYVLLAISTVLAAALLILPFSRWVRPVLFIPLFLTVTCFLQVKYKFCVSYGAAGKQNAAEGDTIAQEIIGQAARKLDRQHTRAIKGQAAVIAAVVTLVLAVLPF